MTLNSDQLGKKGESRFSEICSDAKLVCNPSTYDRTGWDFIVEFPFDPPGEQPSLDKRRAPLSCHVQVKTMWSSNDAFEMRLSSAEKLAKEPKPAFVYVLKVNEKLDPIEAYLIHMLDQNLATVLKRLRREHVKGIKAFAGINRKRITFCPSRTGQQLPPTGQALRTALQTLCGSDPDSYIRKKQEQLETLGFELRPFHAETKVLIPGNEAFVDAFLGLREMEILEWKAFETRFGIELPLNDPNVSKGIMHIQPSPVDQCVIAIRENPLSPPILFEGEMFVPAIQNLPKDQVKFLVKSKLFHFLVDQKKIRFATNAEATQAASLRIEEWANFFKALVILCKGTGTVTITPKRFAAASFPLKIDGKHDSSDYISLAQIFESAQSLMKLAGAIEPSVSLASIAEHGREFVGLNRLFSGATNVSPLGFDVKWPDWVPVSEKLDVIFAGYITITDATTLAYYAVADMRPDEVQSKQTSMVRWRSHTIAPREIVALKDFPASYEKFVDHAKAKEKIEAVMMAEVTGTNPPILDERSR